MVIRLTRTYEFAASHHLHGLRPNHKCMRPHGHNYRIEVTIEAREALVNGMVIDAGDLDTYIKPVIARVDHYSLNEVFAAPDSGPAEALAMSAQPTAENIALWLWEALGFLGRNNMRLVSIVVHENDRLAVEVRA